MALADDLVAYWSLDETSGTRVDSHGSNDLTDGNTVGSAAGKVGNAADFVVTNSEYLTIADNTDMSTGDVDFTFACWVRLASKVVNRDVFGKWRDGSGNGEHTLIYVIGADRFRWHVGDAAGNAYFVDADNFGSPSTDTWYFVVCWHDATNNQIGISVNAGAANTQAHSAGVANNTSHFTIGERGGPGGIQGTGEFMHGLIDEVGFWKRVLTSAERTELYNSDAGRDYAYIIGGGGTTFTRSYSESVGHTNPFARVSDGNRIFSDNKGIIDVYIRVSDGNRIFSDNKGIIDVYTRTSVANRTYSDTTGLNDAYRRLSDAIRIFTDTAGLTDAVTLEQITPGILIIAVVEALGLTDTYLRTSTGNRSLTDTTGTADTYSRIVESLRTLSDTTGLTDAYTRTSSANRSATDNTGTTDAYARLSDALRSVADQAGANENFTRLSNALRVLTDNLALVDAAALQLIAAGAVLLTVSDSLGATDAYARRADALRSFSELIGLTEAIIFYLATGIYPFVIDRVDFDYTQINQVDFDYTQTDMLAFAGG